MEFRYTVRRYPSHVEVEFFGLLVSDAVVAVLEEIAWSSVRSSLGGLLWDLRKADLSAYGIDDMARLRAYDDEEAARAAARPVAPPAVLARERRFRIAAVFAGGSDELILRLWEMAAEDDDGLARRSFEDLEDARRWVAGP